MQSFDKITLLPVDDPGGTLLDVPYVSQPHTNLCWAACCEMIFQSFGRTNVSICQMASEAFHTNCCPDRFSYVCNQPHWPDDVFGAHGFNCAYLEAGLSLANVLYEINSKRPVLAVLHWLTADGRDDGTHMIVIAGYYRNGDLLVKDPLHGEGRLAYEYVNTAYGRGQWSDSYYNLAPGNGASP